MDSTFFSLPHKAYAAGERTDTEKRALATLRESYQRYVNARPHWFELYGSGRIEEATEWRARTTTPFGAETVTLFEQQIDLQQDVAREIVADMNREMQNDRSLLILLSAILFCCATGLSWMAWRLLQPLKALHQRSTEVVQTLFGETPANAHLSETEALIHDFNVMTTRFIAHNTELERARDELTKNSAILESTVAERTSALATALNNLQQHNQEATILNEMGELLQSSITLEDAEKVLIHFAQQLFPDAEGTLYLSDNSRSGLRALITWNHPADVVPPSQINFDECWGLRRAKPYLAMNDAPALRCAHLPERERTASMCLPLAAHGEMFGLLSLCFPNVETDEDAAAPLPGERLRLSLASSLAAQVGVAISNLRLRETLRQQSIQDSLTGLHNRRYLEDRLPREIARAQRTQQSLAIMMLDVDHFKTFNDRFGHKAGDEVLRLLGRTLKDNARSSDLVARYGGEEFAVLLPATGLAQAQNWAERLMSCIRAITARVQAQELPSITISIGLALYPEHGHDGDTVLRHADHALYEAKRTGRDRLVCAPAPRST